MTAFARHQAQTEWGELTWELRSVNHRYLEINLKLPEEVRHLEQDFRQRIGRNMKRGRVDGMLRIKSTEMDTDSVTINDQVVQRLYGLAKQVNTHGADVEPLSTIDVLNWPGVVEVPEQDLESLAAAVKDLLEMVLSDMVATRKREGERLNELIVSRLDQSNQIIENLRSELPDINDLIRTRLEERVAEIRETVDANRLEQELVLLLNKSDVSEEIDRLNVHIDEVRRVLKKFEPSGRRLDFLMQELNREANTLGAKAADQSVTNASVELKVAIDQMREQIQNIE
ncbi:MAG: YicC family protein [Gammaproteobacteria bacterium]|nr:YicC family protein [Gammaproteobacteria bacterium]